MAKGDRDRLRAELAGKAMQGILASSDYLDSIVPNPKRVAELSAEYADALMAEIGIKEDE